MKIYHSFKDLRSLWETHAPSDILASFDFFLTLEESGSIGAESGWHPVIIADENDGILYSFAKNHSYAEFIFDWQWARAYEANGIPYYPKLTSMAPLTPVNTSHFIMKSFNEEAAGKLLKKLEEFYETYNFSSLHFLFVPEEEKSFFEKAGYHLRDSFQYHFRNPYKDFEDFLSHLKTKKAKNLRHERTFTDVTFHQLTGDALLPRHAEQMYEFYLTTIDKKESHAYLTKEFFTIAFQRLKKNLLYVEAIKEGKPIAGSLFLFDEKRLLGRYWGNNEEVPNLHFELCYYQGMDFCFERNIPLFEAGAQGEHKITRGFAPVTIFSAHKIKHPSFETAIANFIQAEKKEVAAIIDELTLRLPFKT